MISTWTIENKESFEKYISNLYELYNYYERGKSENRFEEYHKHLKRSFALALSKQDLIEIIEFAEHVIEIKRDKRKINDE